MGKVVDVQAVRAAYGQLLEQYATLAGIVQGLKGDAGKDLTVKVIRYADRWRAIDPDPTQACQSAARALHRLGATELAWDYLTTPLAEKSNEAQPWVNLASALQQQGDMDLADRAYATAFEREPTNAQV